MYFKFNPRKCLICDKDTGFTGDPFIECDNGCCFYEADPQGGTVCIKIFDSKLFTVDLYEPVHHDDKDVKELLELIEYWKKDYRYLAEILERS